jgi:cephalosporin hydroxylase
VTLQLQPLAEYDLKASWDTFANGEHEITAEGVRTWKLDDDLARYAAIIDVSQPEVVVETGTKWGGSALWFRSRGLDVVTVDIDATFSEGTRQAYPDIHWLIGDSLDPAVLSAVTDLVDGRRCMVVLDSEHAYPHVAAEITAYEGLVSIGCYLVVEDGIFDVIELEKAHLGGERIPAEGGPLKAISEKLAGRAEWQRDAMVERMSRRSHHPAGFWKRRDPEAGKKPPARKAAAKKAAPAAAAA